MEKIKNICDNLISCYSIMFNEYVKTIEELNVNYNYVRGSIGTLVILDLISQVDGDILREDILNKYKERKDKIEKMNKSGNRQCINFKERGI